MLLKVMAKSVSPYALTESSLFLCGLLLKSVMGQLLVGCGNDISLSICTHHSCNICISINHYDSCFILVQIVMNFSLAAWVCVVSQLCGLC